MEEIINCSNKENIISSLRAGEKIVIVTDDDLKSFNGFGKLKVYQSFKRIYSFKEKITIIKLAEDKKIDKMIEGILLILVRSAKRQGVNSIFIPKNYIEVLNVPEFNKYQDIIKITDGKQS